MASSYHVSAWTNTTRPYLLAALRNGKAVFVQRTRDANLREAKEMADFARKNKASSLVGLQGAECPDIQKVKALVAEVRIGKVLSCPYTCAIGISGATKQWIMDYFTERAVGGDMVNSGVWHAMEHIEYSESFSFNLLPGQSLSYAQLKPHTNSRTC